MIVINRQFGLMFLIVIGLLSACASGNQANSKPIVVTRTPQPTFTLRPADPLIKVVSEQGKSIAISLAYTPTARPTKTKPMVCPTMISPPPTAERTPSYEEDILRETTQLVNSSQALLERVREAEQDNPDWVLGTMISSDYIQSSYDYLARLESPAGLEAEHHLLMDAIGACREATYKARGDWETCWVEADELREAERMLEVCLGKVSGLEGIIGEEIAP